MYASIRYDHRNRSHTHLTLNYNVTLVPSSSRPERTLRVALECSCDRVPRLPNPSRDLPNNIDGIDISPQMLQQAASKQHHGTSVYRDLIEADLTHPLVIDDDTYAEAVIVGTFTHGHVGPAALAEVFRVVRSGGRAAIGINAAHFATADFGHTLEQLVLASTINNLELIEAPIYDGAEPRNADDIALIATFEVT